MQCNTIECIERRWDGAGVQWTRLLAQDSKDRMGLWDAMKYDKTVWKGMGQRKVALHGLNWNNIYDREARTCYGVKQTQ
eukprot:scaffold12609_cov17-Prasinocladus_malaysianus.AAC.1